MHHGQSSGIISDKKLIHLPLCYKTTTPCRAWREGPRGEQFPGRPITMGSAEWLRGAPKISNSVTDTSFKTVKFASIRPQMQTWGALTRAPCSLITPLVSCRSTPQSRTALQERNEEGKVAHLPGRQITIGTPNHCGGRRKYQQYHKCFLQYSIIASERSHVRTWGRQTCFLPRAPSNLVTPLLHWQHTWNWFLALQAS